MSRFSFFLLLAFSVARPLEGREPSPGLPEQSAAATFIPWLLQGKEELTQMPLTDVVFHATGKKVLPLDRQNEDDQRVLALLRTTLDEVVKTMSAPDSPIQSVARINEVSGPFENMLRERLEAAEGFTCDYPKTAAGKVQRSGYPDLRLFDEVTKRVYYLDPKLFAAGSRTSSFRTFYFEPKVVTNKITEDAVHLILGFEHAGRQAAHWNFTRWDVVDLSNFKVKLKAEFQGSNRDLYRPEAIVATSAE
jgi:hypothetical protein